MARGITITFNKSQLARARRLLKSIPGGLNRAVPAAINKTTRTAKVRTARAIGQVVNLKINRIKRSIRTSRPASRGHWRRDVIVDESKRIPLAEFGARQNKKGVSYKIARNSPRTTIKYDKKTNPVFLKKLRTGHVGVFKRRTTSRLPIVELRGPSIAAAYETSRRQIRAVRIDTEKVFEKNLLSQVDRILKK